MFQFGGFPSITYGFSYGSMILHHRGFPIRKSTGQSLFPAHRSLSQVIASFIGSWCQGIHLMLFFAWTASLALFSRIFSSSLSFLAWVIANNCFGLQIWKDFQTYTVFRLCFHICGEFVFYPCFHGKTLKFKFNTFFSLQLSVLFVNIRFSMNNLNLTRPPTRYAYAGVLLNLNSITHFVRACNPAALPMWRLILHPQ